MSRRERKLDFTFSATEDAAAGKAELSGLPGDLWQRFVAHAAEIMPEKGANAWAAVLSEVIASIGGGGQTHTLIMTDIPQAAQDALQQAAQSIGSSADQLIALVYKYAEASALHLLRIHDTGDQPTRALLITGIPDMAWQAWALVARGVDEQPEGLFARMLQAAAQGGLKFDKKVEGGPDASSPAHGNGPRVRRPVQPTAEPARPAAA